MEPSGNKTKELLLKEIEILRAKITELEDSKSEFGDKEKIQKEREKKLQGIIQNMIEGFYSSTPDGKLLMYNNEFVNILGLDAGKDYTGIALPDFWQNKEDRKAYIDEFMNKGFIKNYEVKAIRPSGEKIIVQVNSRLVKDPDGKPIRIEGTFLEITKRKQAEKELRKSNSILSSIVDSPDNVIIFSLDLNFNYLRFNKAHIKEMKAIYDVDIEIGKSILSFITNEDDRKKAEINYKRVLKGERFVEIQQYGHAEKRFWYELIFNPILDSSQKVSGFSIFATDISNRKKSEAHIERFRRIFQDSLNEIYLFDTETLIFSYANKAALKNLGYTMAELKQMTPLNFKPEFTADSFEKMIKPLRGGKKEKLVFETVHKRKDQSLYNVEVHLQLLRYENEDFFVAIILDITESKKIQDQLLRQKIKLANVIEGTNAGTWDWNVKTGEVILNDRWAEILGYKLEELQAINLNIWRKSVHPDDMLLIDKALNDHFNKITLQFDEIFRQAHKDGHWVWIHSRGKVIEWTDEGKPLQMSGTHINITKRKQAEMQLLKEKGHFEEIINVLPSFFYQISTDMRFVNWNKNFESISGYSAKDMESMSPLDLFAESERKNITRNIQNVFSFGTAEVEANIVFKNGVAKPFFFNGKRVLIDNEPYLVGMGIDISSLKKAEKELKLHREQLEEMVKDRTKELELKNKELNNAMRVFVGRELKITELQNTIMDLKTIQE